MSLVDRVYASSFKSFNLVAIGCFQQAKYCDATRLELVGGMRGDTAHDNIVFKAELQYLEGLVRSEAVTYEHAWSMVSSFFGLGIELSPDNLRPSGTVFVLGVSNGSA